MRPNRVLRYACFSPNSISLASRLRLGSAFRQTAGPSRRALRALRSGWHALGRF